MIQGLLIAFVLALPQAVPAQQTAPAGTFKITGTVTREDKQEASTAANQNQIRIQGPMTSIVAIGTGGTFEFPNVRPGSYQVVVGPRITMSPVTVVVADKDVTDFRVVVPLSNDVNGTVTVEGNGPRPRFTLAFNRVDATANPVNVTATSTFTVAVPQGQYRLAPNGLPAGYNIKSIMLGAADALTQPITLVPGSSQVLSIVLGVSSPPPWVKVSGRVVGGAATNITMTGAATTDALNTTVGADGAFEFPMVLPGTYTARTQPANPLAGTTPVTVGAADLTNVEIRLPASKEVSGKIALRGNYPMPRLSFSLTPVGAARPAANVPTTITLAGGQVVALASNGVNVPANPGPDGLFKVALPDGDRQITIAGLTPGFNVESFTYGSTDLLKNPLHVALNDTAELSIVVDASGVRPHNISGKVTGLLTTQGVRVVLQGGSLGTGVESPVAPDGSFGFTDILPGNYSARLSLSGEVISTAVIVNATDITNVTINYPRRFYITGHVVVEGDTADPPAIPALTLEARSSTGAVTTSSRESGGVVILQVSDGDNRISVRNVPSGYALKSVMYGDTNLQETPLKVDGPITWEIVVRLLKAG
jgi:hypothetical protein